MTTLAEINTGLSGLEAQMTAAGMTQGHYPACAELSINATSGMTLYLLAEQFGTPGGKCLNDSDAAALFARARQAIAQAAKVQA